MIRAIFLMVFTLVLTITASWSSTPIRLLDAARVTTPSDEAPVFDSVVADASRSASKPSWNGAGPLLGHDTGFTHGDDGAGQQTALVPSCRDGIALPAAFAARRVLTAPARAGPC